ncbi:uncharacterized protein LOC100215158 [Hydra vulgaris]|uniref:Uncharacterized protein LOC100215158 n=1 Tax=Hydra vulgaris TaxID=6087 RepID=A0ABM4C2A6_HYDVU
MNFILKGTFLIFIFYPFVLPQEYDILVLGAGFSGLGAAIQLGKNNVNNFLVLEAKDYIGGRIKQVPFGGVTIELGAGWIHDADILPQKYYDLSKKYNMKLHSVNYANVLYKWKNGTKVDENLKLRTENELSNKYLNMKNIALKRYQEGRGGVNMRTALRMADWIPDTYMKQAAEYFQLDFENGVIPEDIDAITSGSTGSGKDFINADPRGYSFPVLEEAKFIKDKILLKHEVTKIEQLANKKYTVYTTKGTFSAKHVLVTFSTGVLLSKKITFIPELPLWKTEALSMVPMNHYCKIFLQFKNAFWDTKPEYIVVTGNDRGYFQHWQTFDFKTLYPGKNILLATLTGETCKKYHLISDVEVVDEIYAVLKGMYAQATKPTAILRSSWSTDPHVMGSYSTQTGGINEDDYRALDHPVNASLWFTGEYKGREEFGYAHKALELGMEEAERIIKCIRVYHCPEPRPTRKIYCSR